MNQITPGSVPRPDEPQPDLAAAVRRLIADDARARAIARRGWEKTWALFHMDRVWTYVRAQLFDEGGARGYEWPCERWS